MSYDLERFADAQQPVYPRVVAELQRGCKTSHWMWFIFPQIEGLGSSAMARKFAISSLAEAAAYIEHPLLGERLRECTRLINAVEGSTIEEILGPPDDMKFRSSMTLFSHATSDNEIFLRALEKYFSGAADPLTLERLR